MAGSVPAAHRRIAREILNGKWSSRDPLVRPFAIEAALTDKQLRKLDQMRARQTLRKRIRKTGH